MLLMLSFRRLSTSTSSSSSSSSSSSASNIRKFTDRTFSSSLRTYAAKYVDSFYSQTLETPEDRYRCLTSDLPQRHRVDVCVVGGGLAGLSSAYELRKRGISVAIVEAQKIGWGASGRNGGFVFAGFCKPVSELQKSLGESHAKQLFALSVRGVDLVRDRILRHSLHLQGAGVTPGILEVVRYHNPKEAEETVDLYSKWLGLDIRLIDRPEMTNLLRTEKYHWGMMDNHGFHFHPLNYCRAIAAVLSSPDGFEGTPAVLISEDSQAVSLQKKTSPLSSRGQSWEIRTQDGLEIISDHVIVTCGGYISPSLQPVLSRATLPVATYVVTTKPLAKSVIDTAISTRAAVLDTRRCGDYYRLVPATTKAANGEQQFRILWGGRISAILKEPKALSELMIADIISVYPQLRGLVEAESAWSGYMPYATHMMPQIGQLGDNSLWYAMGFGGHGMNTTSMAGELLATAIAEKDDQYKLFAPFGLDWTGGPVIGAAATQIGYWWLQLKDFIQEARGRKIAGARL